MLLLLFSLLEEGEPPVEPPVEPPAPVTQQLMGPDDDYEQYASQRDFEAAQNNQIVMSVLMSIVASGVLED